MSTAIRRVLAALWEHKVWWIVPMVLALVLLALFLLVEDAPGLLPFQYGAF